MRTRTERRKLFPPRAAVRRPHLLAGKVVQGLSPQAAGRQLGFTPEQVAEAIATEDFSIAVADITALVVQGVDAMNADLVLSARNMLEQLVYECEPRVLLYLCHCAHEGKNGLEMIVLAADRIIQKMRDAAATAAVPPEPNPPPAPEPPPRISKYWRKPVSRVDANFKRINLDLRDRLLAAYATIVEARAAEAARTPPKRSVRRRAAEYVSSQDELLAALDAYVARRQAQPDTS